MNYKKLTTFLLTTALTTSLFTSGAAAATYKVQPGDSLWKISTQHKVTVNDLKSLNNLKNDLIFPGQVLTISKDTPVVTPPANTTGAKQYIVKAGDSLWKIATANNLTVADLKSINNLKIDTIYIGQKLQLQAPQKDEVVQPPTTKPTETTEAVFHKVVSGDSLWKLSLLYNVSIPKIKQWNGLTSDMLFVGQMIQVSDGPIKAPTAPAFLADGFFPFAKGTYDPFGDTWGAARTEGRTHEGTDIMAKAGTPIYAVADGKITSFGWNTLGGWRITAQTSDGQYYLYYAHLSKYATGIKQGSMIKKGQLIGYVGNTGQGPEGTAGLFVNHLHFGMYNSNWVALNPYDHLKYWESKM